MRLLIFIFLIALTTPYVNAQKGINFFHGSWKEALDEAKKTGKPIFVDAYAKWCGPCKRMARTTFMDDEAGAFFNENFINVKIDAEEGEGIRFRRKYPVTAFPTLFFIDENGEVLHKVVGAQDVKGLISNGKLALRKVDYSREYAIKYEEGERDPEFIFKYVESLNRSGKSSLKVSNEYLRTQDDLTTGFNLRFIHEAAVEADSRIFKLMIEHQKEIGQLVGLQALKDRILLACENTVKKAVEFKYEGLLDEAKQKMSTHYPEKADAFAAKAEMDYYRSTDEAEKYGKACEDFAKHVANGNSDELFKLANDIFQNFPEHEDCMKMAEKYAKESAGSSNDYAHHLTYSLILQQNGKTKKAIKAAREALEYAKEKGDKEAREVELYIKKLES